MQTHVHTRTQAGKQIAAPPHALRRRSLLTLNATVASYRQPGFTMTVGRVDTLTGTQPSGHVMLFDGTPLTK